MTIDLAAGVPPVFPPIVATYLTKLACELPDQASRSLSLWTCSELARTLVREGIVESISSQTVQGLLQVCGLKPWRVHHWLSAKVPRDDLFGQQVLTVCDLYTREVNETERILSLDELTSIQPRPRSAATKPPLPKGKPALLEHEYQRKGAWNLFAAFDIQTGQVIGELYRRTRPKETIALLEAIDQDPPSVVGGVHIICDNVSIHKGKLVRQWLDSHPRFVMHHTPVHCSWMNHVEQWFSLLRRKRLRAPNFADLQQLAEKIELFINEWNDIAHPFKWTERSFCKILEKIDREAVWTQPTHVSSMAGGNIS